MHPFLRRHAPLLVARGAALRRLREVSEAHDLLAVALYQIIVVAKARVECRICVAILATSRPCILRLMVLEILVRQWRLSQVHGVMKALTSPSNSDLWSYRNKYAGSVLMSALGLGCTMRSE